MSTKKRTRNHYVNNKKMLESLTEYRSKVQHAKQTGGQKPPVPNYLGECIIMIANRLATKSNFYNYTFRDEMVSDGVLNCINYIDNFDPEKSDNPFAYFTQIIYNAFLRRIEREKKEQYTKIKNMQNMFVLMSPEEHNIQETHISQNSSTKLNNDITSDIVKTFEDKLQKKKNKEKLRGIDNFCVITDEVDIPQKM